MDIDFEIGKLNLTRQQIDGLVAFLGRPLVDVLHVVFAEVAAAIVERSICGVSEDGVGSRTVDASDTRLILTAARLAESTWTEASRTPGMSP